MKPPDYVRGKGEGGGTKYKADIPSPFENFSPLSVHPIWVEGPSETALVFGKVPNHKRNTLFHGNPLPMIANFHPSTFRDKNKFIYMNAGIPLAAPYHDAHRRLEEFKRKKMIDNLKEEP